jgi:hypothetical protein
VRNSKKANSPYVEKRYGYRTDITLNITHSHSHLNRTRITARENFEYLISFTFLTSTWHFHRSDIVSSDENLPLLSHLPKATREQQMSTKMIRRTLVSLLLFVNLLSQCTAFSSYSIPTELRFKNVVPITHQRLHRVRSLLTTKIASDDDSNKITPIQRAVRKFRNRPTTYLLIPFIAALVGWFTNWLAVQMIFYPIGFVGIPIYRRPELPLGFLGWQGIIPCKTRPMTELMVDM